VIDRLAGMFRMRTYRKQTVFGLLAAAWIALAGWQIFEHIRAKEAARQTLRNRMTDTARGLSVVIRSQNRFGVVRQQHLEAALGDLARMESVLSVALRNRAGDMVTSAGESIHLSLGDLPARGERWEVDRVIFVYPIDLGADEDNRGTSRSLPIILPEEQRDGRERDDGRRRDGPPRGDDRGEDGRSREFRGGPPPPDGRNEAGPPPGPPGGFPRATRQSFERTSDTTIVTREFPPGTTSESLSGYMRDTRQRSGSGFGPPAPLHQTLERTSAAVILRQVYPADTPSTASMAGPGGEPGDRWRGRGGPGGPRWNPGRPFWMSEVQYQELLQKQGLHGFVLVMSTDAYRAESRKDFWLRLIIACVGLVAAGGLGLSWRNIGRTAELQVRLVRASEMNSHLREMNLAAAGLAHETRNPLNIVRGQAQLIARQPDAPQEIQSRARQITDEVDRVTGRLNEFIEYSRPREAKPAPVDFAALVDDIARTLETDRQEKAVAFEFQGPRLTIEADELLLRQVLFNLLLNAIQAVKPGGRVEVVAADRSPSNGAWFEVRDNGPGVPAHMREDIFRPYFTTNGTGAGLGLAVVRQIVHAHGWDVACAAGETGGASFRVSGLKVVSRNA